MVKALPASALNEGNVEQGPHQPKMHMWYEKKTNLCGFKSVSFVLVIQYNLAHSDWYMVEYYVITCIKNLDITLLI